MWWKRVITIVPAVVLCAAGAAPVRAQAEIEALVYDWPSNLLVARSAIRELGYSLTWVVSENEFITTFNSQPWDLVVLQLPRDDITQKEQIAGLLEDHVAAGGRLLVNFNNLDEWPRLQKLLGVSETRSLSTPLDVLKTDPRHASYSINVPVFPQIANVWPDSGDRLVLDAGATSVGQFQDGTTAIGLANDATTIVNGFDWDSYQGGPSNELIRVQIEYIMACRADLDQSTGAGVLDIFDFLEFQDLFVKQDPLANMDFNASFDIFDFLAFQNAFVNGCG